MAGEDVIDRSDERMDPLRARHRVAPHGLNGRDVLRREVCVARIVLRKLADNKIIVPETRENLIAWRFRHAPTPSYAPPITTLTTLCTRTSYRRQPSRSALMGLGRRRQAGRAAA